MLVQLEFLLSCCRGLQSPVEDEIRTEDERIRLYQQIADDRARIMASGGMAVELTRSMEQVIQGVVMLWSYESEIMEVRSCPSFAFFYLNV
jgi:ABC-type histidine transport system ATPase subunit